MDEAPAGGGPEAPKIRRRVVEADTETSREGRTGCLVVGAVLGIAIGAVFAFFGLPPLINHFFAEEQVPAGQAYTSDARTIRAVSVQEDPTQTLVVLEMTVNSPWTPKPGNFTLEYASGGSWAKATAALDASLLADPAQPVTFDSTNLGRKTDVWVIFPSEPDRGRPRYIHLGDPHIRLEIPGVVSP